MSNPTPIPDYKRALVLRGLSSLSAVASTEDRIGLMEAAADLLEDEKSKEDCRVTARILREAEDAQLRLFAALKPVI